MRTERKIGVLLIIACWLREAHTLFWHLNPGYQSEIITHPCIDRSVFWPISREWIMIMVFDSFYVIALCFSAILGMRRPSRNMQLLFVVQIAYNIIDFGALIFNHRKNDIQYLFLLLATTATIILIIFPFHKKRGKIRHL